MRERAKTWGSETPPGTRRTDKPPPPEIPAKPLTPGGGRRGSGKVPILPPTVKGQSITIESNKNEYVARLKAICRLKAIGRLKVIIM